MLAVLHNLCYRTLYQGWLWHQFTAWHPPLSSSCCCWFHHAHTVFPLWLALELNLVCSSPADDVQCCHFSGTGSVLWHLTLSTPLFVRKLFLQKTATRPVYFNVSSEWEKYVSLSFPIASRMIRKGHSGKATTPSESIYCSFKDKITVYAFCPVVLMKSNLNLL